MIKKIYKLIFILLIIILVTGCSKQTLSGEDFIDLVEKENYQTTNSISQFEKYPQIEEAYIAQNKDFTYQIEYYNLNSESNAKEFYDGNINTFKSDKTKTIKETKLEKTHYEKYIKKTKTKYYELIRVEDTIIYINVDSKYEKEIESIIDKLGY